MQVISIMGMGESRDLVLGKVCNIKTGMDGTWILLLSYYLNLRKMNFTYQVINCTNVGNFRIFSMLKGFQTGKGGEGGC